MEPDRISSTPLTPYRIPLHTHMTRAHTHRARTVTQTHIHTHFCMYIHKSVSIKTYTLVLLALIVGSVECLSQLNFLTSLSVQVFSSVVSFSLSVSALSPIRSASRQAQSCLYWAHCSMGVYCLEPFRTFELFIMFVIIVNFALWKFSKNIVQLFYLFFGHINSV